MKLLNITLAFLCTTSLFAQHERELQKANNMYKNYAYVDAIKIYEKIAEKGYVNQEMLESLGIRMPCDGMNNFLKKENMM